MGTSSVGWGSYRRLREHKGSYSAKKNGQAGEVEKREKKTQAMGERSNGEVAEHACMLWKTLLLA